MFLASANRQGALRDTTDIRQRAVAVGRRAEDLKFFQGGLYVVPTSTEAEAARVAAELDEWIDHDRHLAHMSGSIGIDFGHDDLDTPPVGEIQTISACR